MTTAEPKETAVLGLIDAQIAIRDTIAADFEEIAARRKRIEKNKQLLHDLKNRATQVEALAS